jgi:hypothetical protein
LANLKVWGVPEIKLLHEVNGVLGVEERDSVIFDDPGDDTLDIYISFNGSIQAVVENQLSEKFIQCCSIPENQHRMVRPILNFPLENLRHFLMSMDWMYQLPVPTSPRVILKSIQRSTKK